MNARVIFFTVVLAIATLFLLNGSFLKRVYFRLKELMARRNLLLTLLTLLSLILILISPYINEKTRDFRKNI